MHFSAQIYVAEGSTLSLIGGALIYTDSIIYDKAVNLELVRTKKIEDRIYAGNDSKNSLNDFATKNILPEKNQSKIAASAPLIDDHTIDSRSVKRNCTPADYFQRVFKNSPSQDFKSITEQQVLALVTNGSSKNRKLVSAKNDSLYFIQPGYSDVLVIELKTFCEISPLEICHRTNFTRPPPLI